MDELESIKLFGHQRRLPRQWKGLPEAKNIRKSYKSVVFVIYEELLQFNNKKPAQMKRAEDLDQQFHKDLQIANQHMKRY